MRKSFAGILLILFCSQLKAQNWGVEDDITFRQIGLRLGTGMYSMFGGELQNPRPKIGFQAGLYLYGKKAEKKLNWQTGFEASFSGSNFKNEDSASGVPSSSNYTQIGLIQLDIPLLVNFRVAGYKDNRYTVVQAGIMPGAIISSVVYVGPEKRPLQQTNLNRWENLPLQPVNLMGVVGFQHLGGQAGISIRLRASLLDMNKNFVLPGLLPATGTGKYIGTWGAELGFLF